MQCPVEFDHHDPELASDPFGPLGAIRDSCPMTWSQSWGGFWLATGHSEVALAAKDRRFGAGHLHADGEFQGVSIPTLGQTGRLVPLELNAPECLAYRRLLMRFYSAKRIEARMPEFRTLAAQCVDDIIEDGAADLVPAITERLAGILTLRDIGLPEDDWFEVTRIVEDALVQGTRDPDAALAAGHEICLLVIEQIEDRRDTEDDTLLSDLLRAEIDGEPVSDESIIAMVFLLLLGIHPASALLATTLWYLAEQPELRKQLIDEPSRIAPAAEEFVRWTSPIQSTTRTVKEDLTLGGQQCRVGERVFMSWAAANRDEQVFPGGDRVDLERDVRGHLAYGGGSHYCVGAHLVRAMFTVTVEEVLSRIGDYAIADNASLRWFPDVSYTYGVTSLPVTFTSRLT